MNDLLAVADAIEREGFEIHPFEKAGLGKAPFRCVGVFKNMYQACHGAPIQPGGSCDYCGTGIMYEYKIVSADGAQFKVGCDCVAKTGGESLVAGVRAERLKLARTQRTEKRAERSKHYAEAMAVRKSEERTTRAVEFVAAEPELAAALEALDIGANEFLTKMRDSVREWGSLTPGQLSAVKQTIAREACKAAEKANSVHVGTVGKRYSADFTVVTYTVREHPEFWPPTRSYWFLLKSGDCVFTYRGSKRLGSRGDSFAATFTVKEHTEYKDVKQTVLARPAILKENAAA